MKKSKTFEFRLGVINNLDCSPECGSTLIVVGKHSFTLKDFELQHGHDDSLPYSAILCDNGQELCRCTNDGWGGETDIVALDDNAYTLLEKIGDELNDYKWSFRGSEFNLDITFIADTIALSKTYILHKEVLH